MSKLSNQDKELLSQVRQEIREGFATELGKDAKELLDLATNDQTGTLTTDEAAKSGELMQGTVLLKIMEDVFAKRGI